MARSYLRLTSTFRRFIASGQSGGLLLITCTLVSLLLSNSPIGPAYRALWQTPLGPLSLELWVNDALMAVFFLLIGLELERELYVGELSDLRNALLPIVAAIGGMIVPALIHFLFNAGLPTQSGFGVPMATDIAFAIGALALLGNRAPPALKVFVVAFAVMDDLGAIVVIAAFYTAKLAWAYLWAALAVWSILLVLNIRLRVMALTPYLIGGVLMWVLMLKSGVHATLAGVLLAFAIPFAPRDAAHAATQASPSHRLENALHSPVSLLILPIFALANTSLQIGGNWLAQLETPNSLGIIAGLVLGKPLGVTLFCFVAIVAGVCRLPANLRPVHLVGAGILGGIGFTMSIFITNLAFPDILDAAQTINAAKLAILAASLAAGALGLLWLGVFAKNMPAKSPH